MNGSAHGSASGKMILFVLLVICTGIIVMGILGFRAQGFGPSSQRPVAAPMSRPANVPGTMSALVVTSHRLPA